MEAIPAEGLEQQAGSGLAGDQGGTGISAGEKALSSIQEQAAPEFFLLLGHGGMTGVAVLDQNRTDAVLE